MSSSNITLPPGPYTGDTVPLDAGAIPNLLLIDAENLPFVDGERARPRRIPGSEARLVFTLQLIVPFLFCLIMLIISAETWRRITLVQQNGVTTQATVVDRYVRSSGRSGSSYYIVYEFTAITAQRTPQTINWRERISYERYAGLGRGTRVAVRYLPADPQMVYLADTAPPTLWLVLWFSATGVGFAVQMFALKRVWQDSVLFRRGHLVHGTLAACAPLVLDWQLPSYRLSYRFILPNGTVLEGRKRLNGKRLRETGKPHTGAPVAVIYVDHDLYTLL